jgi:hypothetical protein
MTYLLSAGIASELRAHHDYGRDVYPRCSTNSDEALDFSGLNET